jgi:hypothetical protein
VQFPARRTIHTFLDTVTSGVLVTTTVLACPVNPAAAGSDRNCLPSATASVAIDTVGVNPRI